MTLAPAVPLHVVFLDRDTLSPETVLRPFSFPHRLTLYAHTGAEEIAERIRDADIVITNKIPLRRDTLAQAPKLKMIAVAATGTDVIDLAACSERGIRVFNIRDYALHTVPEHTFALIFALRRSIAAYHDSVKQGRWQESGRFCFFDHPIRDLAGSTLGIIGDGALGQAVAKIATAFGMKVLFAAHKGRDGMGRLYTPFDEVLRRADIITLHCPLTAATRNMIGAREFALMERKPLLINTARGGIVDEQALAEALRGGQIAGAGFDVATVEPPPPDHPLMGLLDLPNFILTPHVAWASREAIQGLADQLVDNIEAAVAGEPRNIVV
ncbi:D-2-hydroxyacid dehydrogenase [Telmatospirillum sp. J64-1]|uniref:D-2-hydroxyacid dehydrogenase n=1 Tax=Telmatospirillum sp. J64-1 TaxID=2502183 RepID=UPI00115F29EC|nr:D-2-hydroxyacid dehydrogenase [Telmatospirillum sp. J64-1]